MAAKKPPLTLLLAFRTAESKFEQMGALLVADGFDAEAIRVLTAWSHTEQSWEAPSSRCPDDGRPTPKAWAWLVRGWRLDYAAIAEGAGVSRQTARQKLAVLLGNKLIYPDGSMAEGAQLAIKGAIKERTRPSGKGGKGKSTEGNN